MGFLFTFWTVSFGAQRFSILQLVRHVFTAGTFLSFSKKSLPNSRSRKFTPMFSSKILVIHSEMESIFNFRLIMIRTDLIS